MKPQKLKLAAVTLAVTLAVGGIAAWHGQAVGEAHAETTSLAQANAPLPRAGVMMPDFREIVTRVSPAVVHISVEGTTRTTARNITPFGQLDPNDPFSQFFRRFGPQFQFPEGEQPRRGQGSGFIVSPDGVILTNAHVVADATTVTVKLNDKREFTAKVVGLDRPTDVAVLKIDAESLPTVPFGDTAGSAVGEWVLAIGAPFGFENSVTAGIISAMSRSLPNEGYVPYIQTDVAINPGNSGGPLLNLDGEVVGINSQIYSRSGGYQGLSFAIPIDVAVQIKDQLLADGRVTRSRLGITIQAVNQELAQSFGLERPRGALVSQVSADSAAARGGLEAGDVILAVNGEAIDESNQLPPRIAAMRPGSDARLEIWRRGEAKTLTLQVEAQPEQLASANGNDAAAAPGRLGVTVRPLSADEMKRAGVSEGLVVVEASGAAARAGIRQGDVILSLNGKPITSADELKTRIEQAGSHVALLVQRQDGRIFVPINLG